MKPLKPPGRLHPQIVIDWLAFAVAEQLVSREAAEELERAARRDLREAGIELRTPKRWRRPAALAVARADERIEEARRLLALDDALSSGNLTSGQRKRVEAFIKTETAKRDRTVKFTTVAAKQGVARRAAKTADRNELIYRLADALAGEGVHRKRAIAAALLKKHKISLSQKQIGRILERRPAR